MKHVAIFDDCYDDCEKLEKNVNAWIEEEKINVVDIRINPITRGYFVEDTLHYRTGEPVKSVDNTVFWCAVVIYEVE